MKNEAFALELTREQALVLFDWLVRFNESDYVFEDQAEQRVLWDIECLMEKKMPVVLNSNYSELVKLARAKIRDDDG